MAELISIITPAFQAEAFIYRCVSSVLAQTYVDWEMLIVADDRVDYQALLRKRGIYDPRVRFLSSKKYQSGPNAARNIALQAARGQWIAPLDADDIFYRERLEHLYRAAQETGLSLDNGYVVQENQSANPQLIFEAALSHQFSFANFRQSRIPLLFLFYRGLIVQGWDVDVERGSDTLFNLRALEAAGYARFVARPLHEYWVHGQSVCHCPCAAEKFDLAYLYAIGRLNSDGLGFHSSQYREQVAELLREKMQINRLFESALRKGFTGNYQQFIAKAPLNGVA